MELPQALVRLLVDVDKQSIYLQALAEGDKLYYLTPYKLGKITPNKILKLYRKLCKRYYMTNSVSTANWYENQLKIFVWTVINYGFVMKKNIQQMTQEDFRIFSSIFNNRDIDTVQFQAKSLVRISKRKFSWNSEQIQLLTELISHKKKLKWSEIALEFYILSDKKFFRSAKQCRQQWINHIDPSKDKGQWQLNEDIILFQSVLQMGRKWSQIARFLNNTRTQHMVKNRFHSILNIYQKKYAKYSEQQLIETVLQTLQNKAKQSLVFQAKMLQMDKTQSSKQASVHRSHQYQKFSKKQEIAKNQQCSHEDILQRNQIEDKVKVKYDGNLLTYENCEQISLFFE